MKNYTIVNGKKVWNKKVSKPYNPNHLADNYGKSRQFDYSLNDRPFYLNEDGTTNHQAVEEFEAKREAAKWGSKSF